VSPKQEKHHKILKGLGHGVWVVDSVEDFERRLEDGFQSLSVPATSD
jgi:hypothetical protein